MGSASDLSGLVCWHAGLLGWVAAGGEEEGVIGGDVYIHIYISLDWGVFGGGNLFGGCLVKGCLFFWSCMYVRWDSSCGTFRFRFFGMYSLTWEEK